MLNLLQIMAFRFAFQLAIKFAQECFGVVGRNGLTYRNKLGVSDSNGRHLRASCIIYTSIHSPQLVIFILFLNAILLVLKPKANCPQNDAPQYTFNTTH